METISISEFKATCLSILERVRKTGHPVRVTKRGTPIAEVVPTTHQEPQVESAFGCMTGTAEELEDILEPLPESDWEVLR